MAYFAYDSVTGQLLQVSNYEIVEVPGTDNPAISTHPLSKEALQNEYSWNSEAREFRAKETLTRLEFLRRFTAEERIAIREAAKTNAVIFDAMELVNLAEFISLSDQDTINLVGYLALQGIITPTRVSEILQ